MADPARRSAARWATMAALPAAILVAFLSLWALGGLERATNVPATPPTAGPVPTAPIPVPTRALAPDAAAVCRALMAGLPSSIPAGHRRPVAGATQQAAAYGEPAIVVTCGTRPPSLPGAADVWGLNGVCWYAEPAGTFTTWTTVDRVVPVSVSVPGPADGSAQSVIPFSTAIAAVDARAPEPPSGCR